MIRPARLLLVAVLAAPAAAGAATGDAGGVQPQAAPAERSAGQTAPAPVPAGARAAGADDRAAALPSALQVCEARTASLASQLRTERDRSTAIEQWMGRLQPAPDEATIEWERLNAQLRTEVEALARDNRALRSQRDTLLLAGGALAVLAGIVAGALLRGGRRRPGWN